MPRVVLMCGPAGSGKSFVARQLERDGLVRLSFDEDAWRRGIRAMPIADDVAADIERDLNARLVTLVGDNCDVVVDRAFWSRQTRDDYRTLLAPLGAFVETMYVDTPRDVALARVAARRRADANDFPLTAELAAAYFDNFDVPTAEEGALTVVSGVG